MAHRDRIARYEMIGVLHQQQLSEREIARSLKMSRKTVHKFLVSESFPERSQRSSQRSILDPYKSYVLNRWKEGCWNGAQLLEEVKKLGYSGSDALFRLFMARVRKETATEGSSVLDAAKEDAPMASACIPSIKRRLSAARASWLSVKPKDKLDEKQPKVVEQICAAHDDLALAYALSQEFVSMLGFAARQRFGCLACPNRAEWDQGTQALCQRHAAR